MTRQRDRRASGPSDASRSRVREIQRLRVATGELGKVTPPKWGKVHKGLGRVAIALEVAGIGLAMLESGQQIRATLQGGKPKK